MTDLSDLQKALKQKARTIYDIYESMKKREFKTVSYPDDYEWLRVKDVLDLLSSYVCIERKVVEDFLERHCFCTKETRKLLLEAQKLEAKT